MVSGKKQNICIISVPLLNIAGSEKHVSDLIELVILFSKNLYVICGGFYSPDPHVHVIGNQKPWPVTNSVSKKIIRYILNQFSCCINLIKVRKKIDIAIFHSGTQLFVIPLMLLILLKKRSMIIHQGSFTTPLQEIFLEKWWGLGKIIVHGISVLETLALILVDNIVMESKHTREFYSLQKFEKKTLIGDYTYVDVEKYQIKVKLHQREKIIGYVGQFIEAKGVTNFTRAIPLIRKAKPEIKFLMAGKIAESNIIEDILEKYQLMNDVTVLNRIPPEEVPGLLNGLYLLVLPSISEGLPAILRQAMACGTPTLATPVGGIPDLIIDKQTGFLLPDNKPETIAEYVISIINMPDLQQLTENARNLIIREYSTEPARRRWESILSSGEYFNR